MLWKKSPEEVDFVSDTLTSLVENVNHASYLDYFNENLKLLLSFIAEKKLSKAEISLYPSLSVEFLNNLYNVLNTLHPQLGFSDLEQQYTYIYYIEYRSNYEDFIPVNKKFDVLFTDAVGNVSNTKFMRYGYPVINRYLCYKQLAGENYLPRKHPELMPQAAVYGEKVISIIVDNWQEIKDIPKMCSYDDNFFAQDFLFLTNVYLKLEKPFEALRVLEQLRNLNIQLDYTLQAEISQLTKQINNLIQKISN